jgi:serine/threonine-protein kinase RsbW
VEVAVKKSDGAVVISLTGEIVDRMEQAVISDLVTEKLDEGERAFVLDMSGVPYISSLGIAVLVTTHVKVDRAGGQLRLVNPRPRVAQVLDMTKVSEVFQSYTSIDEALTLDWPPDAGEPKRERSPQACVGKRMTFELPSTPDSVNRVGAMLADFFDKQDLSEEVAFDVKLAVQEAVVNAAEHGNEYDESKTVCVCCEATGGAIKVTVADEGPGFDPCCVPDPTLPENILRESGRGVFLMRKLCDEVCYSNKANKVTIIKYLED